MKSVFDSIITGLNEAIDDTQSNRKKLRRNTVTIEPVKVYHADDIRRIRANTGMSQTSFAGFLGVSNKTVEAWEAGTNHPSGSASRILSMMEINKDLTTQYPFVRTVSG